MSSLASTPVAPSAADQYSAVEATPATAPTSAPSPDARSTYDAIPVEQIESILHRIHLVERIAEKYGRAYDYRTRTTRELEATLAELDRSRATRESVRKSPTHTPAIDLPSE